MLIQVLYSDDAYLPEVRYLCRLLGAVMQVRLTPCHVSCADPAVPGTIGYAAGAADLPAACKIRIVPDERFWEHYLAKQCPEMHLRERDGLAVLNAGDSEASLTRDDRGIVTNLDLFASAFFMITGMEEILNPALRDAHGRFAYSMSKYAPHYVGRPLINEYAATLCAWIADVYDMEAPGPRRLTGAASHDIDMAYFFGSLRVEAGELLHSVKGGGKYRKLSNLAGYLGCRLGLKRDPYDTYDYMREREGDRGIPATYFILRSKDNSWGRNDRRLARLLRQIQDAGDEVAVHPGYDASADEALLAAEKQGLEELAGSAVHGARSHFLRFKLPETYHMLARLGLSYDATAGFPDHEGFKCGICTPYKPFDIQRREEVDIIEIPLVCMDGTLRDYRKQSPEAATEAVEHITDFGARYGGVVTLSWHNSFLGACGAPWRGVYEQSLDCSLKRGARFMAYKDVAALWREYWG